MTDRKFYEKTFKITVVSEQPVVSPLQLSGIISEDSEEGAVWCSRETQTRKLNGSQTAVRLLRMGATPELFNLTPSGDDVT